MRRALLLGLALLTGCETYAPYRRYSCLDAVRHGAGRNRRFTYYAGSAEIDGGDFEQRLLREPSSRGDQTAAEKLMRVADDASWLDFAAVGGGIVSLLGLEAAGRGRAASITFESFLGSAFVSAVVAGSTAAASGAHRQRALREYNEHVDCGDANVVDPDPSQP
jgi:hypothetical protein